jgi:hypothetical protein
MLQYLIFLQQTESVIEVEVNLNVVERDIKECIQCSKPFFLFQRFMR